MTTRTNKSHKFSSFTYIAISAAFLLWIQAAPAPADNISLVLANDFLASNELDDDLYTAAFLIDIDQGHYRWQVGENLFTDKDNGLRFDETFLTVERSVFREGPWRVWGQAGVLHVGEGFLGENAQNSVHGLIGGEDVELDYIDEDSYHATARVKVDRDLPDWRRVDFSATAEVYGAFGFKTHASTALQARRPINRIVTLHGALGGRYSTTELDALDARTQRFGVTWEAGAVLYDKVSLAWSQNHFGTGSQHFNVVYHVEKESRQGRLGPKY